MSEYGYIPEAPEQSAFNNKGIFKPKDIYNLDQADKWTPQLGQLELIETQTVSDVNFVDFTNLKENEYNVHFVTVSNLQATGSSTSNGVQLFESGVLETSSVYAYAYQEQDLGTSTVTENRNDSSSTLGIDYDHDAQTPRNNYFYLYNAGDSSKYTFATWHYAGINNGGLVYKFGNGVLKQTSVVDGFRIINASGSLNINIDSVSVYGIKEYS